MVLYCKGVPKKCLHICDRNKDYKYAAQLNTHTQPDA